MKTRHLNEFLLRLERVLDIGVVTVERAELARWFDVARVGKATWRAVQEHWEELLEGTKWGSNIPLLVGYNPGCYVFVWGQGLVPQGEGTRWLINVKDKIGDAVDAD